ncbi:MAG TPA: ABC transporter ATP-binding protein [Candidatus Binatia bacterium]|jgi:ATP-binding cassette subfamily B protein|nr:ABC transporter ATP-binding protein [Candidatus Binatia bacterium]
MATAKPTTLIRLRRLTPFVSPFLRRLIFVFLLSLFGTVLGLLWPLFTKILIDDVLLAKNLHLLFVLSGVMVAATALGYGIGALNRYYYTQITARILFALRQHLFAHLQALALRFHTRAKVGDLLSRLNTDISEVQSVLTDAAFAFVTNVFVLLATVGFLVWLNWQLFLVSLLVVPVQLYAVSKVRPLVVEETRKVRELNATIVSFLVESLSAIKFLKLFTAEGIQLDKLGILGERFVRLVTHFEMLNYLGSTASTATTFLGGALTTLYGGYLVIQGEMTIGGLIAFSTYQSRAFSPLQALLDLYLRIERAGVSLDRIFEFLDLGKEQEERSGAVRLSQLRGDLEFREVTFAYEVGEPVLRQVSFHVPAGERLTILGPSGTGKTTVADLLVRLYEPSGGTILLDGHDVRQYDLPWLRRQVVVISHEPVLFHASLAENLHYASPEASWEEVTAAATAVGLHEFIVSLPQGYNTLVGERGARLSAGQKQRVALARAVLKKPKVLVLDEALSGLDVVSEAEVRQALDALMAGRTTLVVTHRLSSLRGDDAVIVLDAGRVVWEGRYGDVTSFPGEMRARLREWESQGAQGSPGSAVHSPELLALRR